MTAMYATPFTVGVKAHEEGATDAHGNPAESWAEPVTEKVYGWGPAGTSEPFNAGREAVEWDLDLYVPPGFTCGRKDLVEVLGVDYKVEGIVESYDFGPFGFKPGSRVRLKKVIG